MYKGFQGVFLSVASFWVFDNPKLTTKGKRRQFFSLAAA
jgi:hypothetical protein